MEAMSFYSKFEIHGANLNGLEIGQTNQNSGPLNSESSSTLQKETMDSSICQTRTFALILMGWQFVTTKIAFQTLLAEVMVKRGSSVFLFKRRSKTLAFSLLSLPRKCKEEFLNTNQLVVEC